VSERLVRQVVLDALKGEIGDGGWLKIDAPKATDKELSLAVMEAKERGLVEACDVSNHDPHYPEWRLVGPTGASEGFIRQTRVSKKVWAGAVVIVGTIVAFLAWLIPIVVSLLKK
jgi:hypothetical protein